MAASNIPVLEGDTPSMSPAAKARRETAGEDKALLKHIGKNIENKYTGSINSTSQQVKRKFGQLARNAGPVPLLNII